jgi:hypothetical protein
MCTVHSFPHNIDHCLTFARSEFEGHLEKAPAEANAFLLQPAAYIQVPASFIRHLGSRRWQQLAAVVALLLLHTGIAPHC